MLKQLKGFFGIMIAVPLAGAAMGAVGSAAAIPAGIGSATQSLIGVGVVGHAASISKGFFKRR